MVMYGVNKNIISILWYIVKWNQHFIFKSPQWCWHTGYFILIMFNFPHPHYPTTQFRHPFEQLSTPPLFPESECILFASTIHRKTSSVTVQTVDDFKMYILFDDLIITYSLWKLYVWNACWTCMKQHSYVVFLQKQSKQNMFKKTHTHIHTR